MLSYFAKIKFSVIAKTDYGGVIIVGKERFVTNSISERFGRVEEVECGHNGISESE
jgi:hypothetical protein